MESQSSIENPSEDFSDVLPHLPQITMEYSTNIEDQQLADEIDEDSSAMHINLQEQPQSENSDTFENLIRNDFSTTAISPANLQDLESYINLHQNNLDKEIMKTFFVNFEDSHVEKERSLYNLITENSSILDLQNILFLLVLPCKYLCKFIGLLSCKMPLFNIITLFYQKLTESQTYLVVDDHFSPFTHINRNNILIIILKHTKYDPDNMLETNLPLIPKHIEKRYLCKSMSF